MTTHSGIYTPLGAEDCELCHPVDKKDFEQINISIDGTARQASWKPIRMRLIRQDEGRNLAYSDSPWLGSHAIIFRSSVLDTLGHLLQRYGEVLPVLCSGVDLWIFNPTNVIDALDEAASSVIHFGSGRIMMVERYVFKSDVVAGNEIFKIPLLRVSPTFVSHEFVDCWKESGLTGLEFKQVWARQDP
jgi:hypothetical protein